MLIRSSIIHFLGVNYCFWSSIHSYWMVKTMLNRLNRYLELFPSANTLDGFIDLLRTRSLRTPNRMWLEGSAQFHGNSHGNSNGTWWESIGFGLFFPVNSWATKNNHNPAEFDQLAAGRSWGTHHCLCPLHFWMGWADSHGLRDATFCAASDWVLPESDGFGPLETTWSVLVHWYTIFESHPILLFFGHV